MTSTASLASPPMQPSSPPAGPSVGPQQLANRRQIVPLLSSSAGDGDAVVPQPSAGTPGTVPRKASYTANLEAQVRVLEQEVRLLRTGLEQNEKLRHASATAAPLPQRSPSSKRVHFGPSSVVVLSQPPRPASASSTVATEVDATSTTSVNLSPAPASLRGGNTNGIPLQGAATGGTLVTPVTADAQPPASSLTGPSSVSPAAATVWASTDPSLLWPRAAAAATGTLANASDLSRYPFRAMTTSSPAAAPTPVIPEPPVMSSAQVVSAPVGTASAAASPIVVAMSSEGHPLTSLPQRATPASGPVTDATPSPAAVPAAPPATPPPAADIALAAASPLARATALPPSVSATATPAGSSSPAAGPATVAQLETEVLSLRDALAQREALLHRVLLELHDRNGSGGACRQGSPARGETPPRQRQGTGAAVAAPGERERQQSRQAMRILTEELFAVQTQLSHARASHQLPSSGPLQKQLDVALKKLKAWEDWYATSATAAGDEAAGVTAGNSNAIPSAKDAFSSSRQQPPSKANNAEQSAGAAVATTGPHNRKGSPEKEKRAHKTTAPGWCPHCGIALPAAPSVLKKSSRVGSGVVPCGVGLPGLAPASATSDLPAYYASLSSPSALLPQRPPAAAPSAPYVSAYALDSAMFHHLTSQFGGSGAGVNGSAGAEPEAANKMSGGAATPPPPPPEAASSPSSPTQANETKGKSRSAHVSEKAYAATAHQNSHTGACGASPMWAVPISGTSTAGVSGVKGGARERAMQAAFMGGRAASVPYVSPYCDRLDHAQQQAYRAQRYVTQLAREAAVRELAEAERQVAEQRLSFWKHHHPSSHDLSATSDSSDRATEVFYDHQSGLPQHEPTGPSTARSGDNDARKGSVDSFPASTFASTASGATSSALVGTVDEAVVTMDHAVRVPSALRGAGRRTMFDVLVDVAARQRRQEQRQSQPQESAEGKSLASKPSTTTRDAQVLAPHPSGTAASSLVVASSAREVTYQMLFPRAAVAAAAARMSSSGPTTPPAVGSTRELGKAYTLAAAPPAAASAAEPPSPSRSERIHRYTSPVSHRSPPLSSPPPPERAKPDRRLRHLLPAHLRGCPAASQSADDNSHRHQLQTARQHEANCPPARHAGHRAEVSALDVSDISSISSCSEDDTATPGMRHPPPHRGTRRNAAEPSAAASTSHPQAPTAVARPTLLSRLIDGGAEELHVLMGTAGAAASSSHAGRPKLADPDSTSSRGEDFGHDGGGVVDLRRDLDDEVPQWVRQHEAARERLAHNAHMLATARVAAADKARAQVATTAAASQAFFGKPRIFYPSSMARRTPSAASYAASGLAGGVAAWSTVSDVGRGRHDTRSALTAVATAAGVPRSLLAFWKEGKRLLKQRSSNATAVAVVEYLWQRFQAWKPCGLRLLHRLHSGFCSCEAAAPPAGSSLSRAEHESGPGRLLVNPACDDAVEDAGGPIEDISGTTSSDDDGGHASASQQAGIAAEAFTRHHRDEGIELQMKVRYMESAFNVVAVHDDAETTPAEQQRRWTFLVPEPALTQVPVLLQEYLYLAPPYTVLREVQTVLSSYNFTTDALLRQHAAEEKAAQEERQRRRALDASNVAGVAAQKTNASLTTAAVAGRAAADAFLEGHILDRGDGESGGRQRGVSPTRSGSLRNSAAASAPTRWWAALEGNDETSVVREAASIHTRAPADHADAPVANRSPTSLRREFGGEPVNLGPTRPGRATPLKHPQRRQWPVEDEEDTHLRIQSADGVEGHTPTAVRQCGSGCAGASPEPHQPPAQWLQGVPSEQPTVSPSYVRASTASVNSISIDGFYDPLAMPALPTTGAKRGIAAAWGANERRGDGGGSGTNGLAIATADVTTVLTRESRHGAGREFVPEDALERGLAAGPRQLPIPPQMTARPSNSLRSPGEVEPAAGVFGAVVGEDARGRGGNALSNEMSTVTAAAISADPLMDHRVGGGFPRGPTADWDIPVEVLFALSGGSGQWRERSEQPLRHTRRHRDAEVGSVRKEDEDDDDGAPVVQQGLAGARSQAITSARFAQKPVHAHKRHRHETRTSDGAFEFTARGGASSALGSAAASQLASQRIPPSATFSFPTPRWRSASAASSLVSSAAPSSSSPSSLSEPEDGDDDGVKGGGTAHAARKPCWKVNVNGAVRWPRHGTRRSERDGVFVRRQQQQQERWIRELWGRGKQNSEPSVSPAAPSSVSAPAHALAGPSPCSQHQQQTSQWHRQAIMCTSKPLSSAVDASISAMRAASASARAAPITSETGGNAAMNSAPRSSPLPDEDSAAIASHADPLTSLSSLEAIVRGVPSVPVLHQAEDADASTATASFFALEDVYLSDTD
ncbi:hypothetical protein CGC21_19030 [Leishmania donovani]|uniref:Uncharacterized protein n=1 Tax=Leishmania donovani TaxID=5661 RepID=A0A504XT56_LEIDO|nr:hypothetical protein CGC21_19030 [Leishmania donovani]